jgi:hypothetical protein
MSIVVVRWRPIGILILRMRRCLRWMALALRRPIRMRFLSPHIPGQSQAASHCEESYSELEPGAHVCLSVSISVELRSCQKSGLFPYICCESFTWSACTGGGNSFNGSKFESTS